MLFKGLFIFLVIVPDFLHIWQPKNEAMSIEKIKLRLQEIVADAKQFDQDNKGIDGATAIAKTIVSGNVLSELEKLIAEI